ncbi:uncharacterized protein LOC132201680 [Neocloeon triangulifer]|uniref:uncharacterized protein LOC132201680 n=1 Tax=Neocloeon triangulifer TaxID=2078957 RepID=UPI00286FAD85|nr:uncharacterized protein LOC132201680 [Neocloeon triangulifer]
MTLHPPVGQEALNALHWAAKHGNLDVIKLIAGAYQVNPNIRSGLTPLHLAVQFGHDEVRDLLIRVYGADPDIRDFSGKKPEHYNRPRSNSASTETIHKIKSRKKSSEKDLGFLRIGSLNVRVKRTTEAFSNFFHNQHNTDRIHKTWGSADNIQEPDQNTMPPPKTLPKSSSKRRRPRRSPSAASIQVVSKPVPVSLPISAVSLEHINLKSSQQPNRHHHDSDSDTAAGFGDSWK